MVKPVVGVTSAAVSVVQGASNATNDSASHAHVRLRRALPIHAQAGGNGLGMAYITPYSAEAAWAQRSIMNMGGNKEKKDHRVKYVENPLNRQNKI